MKLDEDMLYRIVGEKVRHARERVLPRMSQASLAQKLGVSRASIVNIEAGRQRAPLHVLWRIAELLGTEPALLLPRQAEYAENTVPLKLDSDTVAQIEAAANGDPATRRDLTHFISNVKARPQT